MARSAAPAIGSRRFPKYLEVQAGPWNTLNDSLDTFNASPEVAKRLDNIYSLDGASTLGRPGVSQVGGAAPGAVQAHGQLTMKDGTERTYRITNGLIQYLDWSGPTWSTAKSAANLASASITLSTTARCGCINYNGTLVVSDGVNKAFTWNGDITNGTTGLQSLTATAGAWYGVPAVKDAKLFGILASDRLTIEWSNVNSANTGYAGSSQQWSLGQVSETPLTAIVGLNDALIVFRERMCQPILGAVNATYTTSATRATLSENIGTLSPFAIAVWNNRVFFIDADGRPQVIAAGSGMLYNNVADYGPDAAPFWKNLREFSKTVDKSKLASKAAAAIFPGLNLVMLGMARTTDTNAGIWVMIDPGRNVPVSLWSGFEFLCPGIVKDSTNAGTPKLMFADANGYSYTYGDPMNGPFDDQLQTGTVAVTHTIEGTPLSPDRDTEAQWHEASITLRLETNQSVGLSMRTPNGTNTPQTVSVVGNKTLWDNSTAIWDTSKWSSDATERNVNIGFNVAGRWVCPIITHSKVGEQFGVVGITVHGTRTRDDPSVR